MDKYIFDESNGLWYELHGDYYLPCLTLPEEEYHIGIWGQRHKRYLKQEHHIIYQTMLSKGTLFQYLEEVDRQAEEMLRRLLSSRISKTGHGGFFLKLQLSDFLGQLRNFGFQFFAPANREHRQTGEFLFHLAPFFDFVFYLAADILVCLPTLPSTQ